MTGCSLYFTPDPTSSGSGEGDAGVPPSCEPHTATIFEPSDGAVVPRALDTRVRWNEPGIPDRYEDFHDDFGNFFQSTGVPDIQGDGSLVEHYMLPANGSFTLEIGWFCNAASPTDEHTIALAHVHFTTGAN